MNATYIKYIFMIVSSGLRIDCDDCIMLLQKRNDFIDIFHRMLLDCIVKGSFPHQTAFVWSSQKILYIFTKLLKCLGAKADVIFCKDIIRIYTQGNNRQFM